MSQQQKTETDRLANIIQVLQLGHKTGLLIVERDEGSTFEQAAITFVQGQITQARTNHQQGAEALRTLRFWGRCRFAFSANQPTTQLPAFKPPQPTAGNITAGHSATSPVTSVQRNSQTMPLREPAPRSLRPPSSLTTPTTGKFAAYTANTPWLAIPYRTRQLEDGIRLIEQIGLSRTHRRLFLLVDGQRMLKDLIRLMTLEPGEALRLFQDLERAGVVQL